MINFQNYVIGRTIGIELIYNMLAGNILSKHFI